MTTKTLDLGSMPQGTSNLSLSDLERAAEQYAHLLETDEEDRGLHAHLNGNDPRLLSLAGQVTFSTAAFSNYLGQFGNTELTREAFRIVLERTVPADARYTRMGWIVNDFINSLYAVRGDLGSLNRKLLDEIQYTKSERAIKLYAGANPSLDYEALAATPRIHVRLETRR